MSKVAASRQNSCWIFPSQVFDYATIRSTAYNIKLRERKIATKNLFQNSFKNSRNHKMIILEAILKFCTTKKLFKDFIAKVFFVELIKNAFYMSFPLLWKFLNTSLKKKTNTYLLTFKKIINNLVKFAAADV